MMELELWVVVDEAGNYAVGTDEALAAEAYEADNSGQTMRRAIKIMLSVPTPKPVEVRGTIPPESEAGCTK